MSLEKRGRLHFILFQIISEKLILEKLITAKTFAKLETYHPTILDTYVLIQELKEVQELKFNRNLSKNFKKFKQNLEIDMLATGKYKKEDEVKVAILLNIIGEEAVNIYNTFNLSDEDRKKYEKQEEMESFDNFVTELKKLAVSCEFGDQRDSLIRDRIALGVTNKNLQERLMGKEDLTLEKAEMDMSVKEVNEEENQSDEEDKVLKISSIEIKIDSAAEVNILPLNMFDKYFTNHEIKKTNVMLEVFGGSKTKAIGCVQLKCSFEKGKEKMLKFIEVDVKSNSLLGCESSQLLGIIKTVNEVGKFALNDKSKTFKEYKENFKGLGKFKEKYKMTLKPNCDPVAMLSRKIPLGLRNKVQNKLNELEKLKIISMVEDPGEWINNLVIVEKPQDLNKAIQ
ncbi:uncharacterized protein [Onthophagus taurus]|uniref:uncharacterized protein n=1 Tax=Onthophagus taurus TaxID=166361 RepID=UPI0039BEB8E8